MALELNITSIVQSNDNKVLRITDGTGTYDVSGNPTGWGSPNPAVTSIGSGDLTLAITITTSDETETVYDDIDVYAYLGNSNPTAITDLVFDITADLLEDGGTPLGTSDDELPDGWYVLEYTIADDGSASPYTYTETFFVDGQTRTKIYTDVIAIPDIYESDPKKLHYKDWYELYEPIYKRSLFLGMLYNLDDSTKTQTLSILNSLETLLDD